MHEVRATVPVETSAAIARIALDSGIAEVSVYDVFVHGPEQRKHVVSVECSSPQAKAFLDALLASPVFDLGQCSVSSREVRAILNASPLAEITRPMVEPAPDIIEDLWQMSHVTPSYVGRAAGPGGPHNPARELFDKHRDDLGIGGHSLCAARAQTGGIAAICPAPRSTRPS